jgi:hypothetical protein
MDWREMAGQPTVRGLQGEERWSSYYGAWSGGKQVGGGWEDGRWDGRTDPIRGWVIAASWFIASSAEYVFHDAHVHALTPPSNSIYYLYALIRRPRLILDFSFTLVFNHLLLTTYYSASIPASFFFWLIMFAGSAWMVIITEQLCVKREMTEGLVISAPRDEADEVEMGGLLRRD